MNKPLMHIMIDDNVATNEAIHDIEECTQHLSDKYDIVVTASTVQIAVSDQKILEEMDQKIDLLIGEIDKLNTLRRDIRKDIKYVFGLNKY